MRILWLSNSPRTPTGYGNQTGLFLPRLKSAGHDVALVSFFGIEGSPLINQHGILELPRLRDPYGNDAVADHYRYHRAEAVVTLIDPFVLAPTVYNSLNWVAWTPIDSEPILPENVAVLQSAKCIWAMSKFGERQLKLAGFTNVDYVPHGVDSRVFHRLNKAHALNRLKNDCGIDLAGKFVVSMNSANKGTPSRKGFFEAFASFKAFSDEHPDAVLYLHTERDGLWHGEHLPTLAQMLGLAPDRLIYAPQYHYVNGMLPPSYLTDIYNISDVFLHTSHGGGFEIPLVEAQLCGTPVIVTDFSAMSELCFAGWKIPGVPFMHATGATQRLPIIGEVVRALHESYQRRDDFGFRQQARVSALDYDADLIFRTYLQPALANVVSPTPTPMNNIEVVAHA